MDQEFSILHCDGCSRTFTDSGPLANHRRTCRPTKRRLNTALGKAKEIRQNRKRIRLENDLQSQNNPLSVTPELEPPPSRLSEFHPHHPEGACTSDVDSNHTSIDEVNIATVRKT